MGPLGLENNPIHRLLIIYPNSCLSSNCLRRILIYVFNFTSVALAEWGANCPWTKLGHIGIGFWHILLTWIDWYYIQNLGSIVCRIDRPSGYITLLELNLAHIIDFVTIFWDILTLHPHNSKPIVFRQLVPFGMLSHICTHSLLAWTTSNLTFNGSMLWFIFVHTGFLLCGADLHVCGCLMYPCEY